MKSSLYCPVCRVNFKYKDPLAAGETVICPVCGARLLIEAEDSALVGRKFPQSPREEIIDRVNNYARLKGYVFDENKEMILEGLMEKKEAYGDFFCPCKFDNVPENICPCLETRSSEVRKTGKCF